MRRGQNLGSDRDGWSGQVGSWCCIPALGFQYVDLVLQGLNFGLKFGLHLIELGFLFFLPGCSSLPFGLLGLSSAGYESEELLHGIGMCRSPLRRLSVAFQKKAAIIVCFSSGSLWN